MSGTKIQILTDKEVRSDDIPVPFSTHTGIEDPEQYIKNMQLPVGSKALGFYNSKTKELRLIVAIRLDYLEE